MSFIDVVFLKKYLNFDEASYLYHYQNVETVSRVQAPLLTQKNYNLIIRSYGKIFPCRVRNGHAVYVLI